jgi:molybdopterin-guanine dinucleotide biosynthesis protein A
VWIAGARAPELAAYAPVIPDEWDDVGPLGGVCSALRSIERTWGVFLPVDQPLVPCELVVALLGHARVTGSRVAVASLRGEAQTFPAVVRRDALAVFERELAAGLRGCLAAFRAAGLQVIAAEEVDAPDAMVERWFWNANTPEDLERLRAALQTP